MRKKGKKGEEKKVGGRKEGNMKLGREEEERMKGSRKGGGGRSTMWHKI